MLPALLPGLGDWPSPTGSFSSNESFHVICTVATSVSVEHRPKDIDVVSKRRSGSGWYAHLFEEKKAEHLKKLRMTHLQKIPTYLSVNVNVPWCSAPQVSSGNFEIKYYLPSGISIPCNVVL